MTNARTPSGEPNQYAATGRIDEAVLQRLSTVFRLLSDKNRFKIILSLASERELHVKALGNVLRQSQPAVSHHLALMRMIGLVDFRRTGKHKFYFIAWSYFLDLFEQIFTGSGNGAQQLQFPEFTLTLLRRSAAGRSFGSPAFPTVGSVRSRISGRSFDRSSRRGASPAPMKIIGTVSGKTIKA